MKEEGSVEVKREAESAEDEKETDTKESDETNAEQKQDEGSTEEEKLVEKADADEEEKPEAVAIEMTEGVEQVSVPIEEEAKTESGEVGEGEVKTESTEGGEDKPSQEDVVPVAVETTVTNEMETGADHSKYDELDDELPWAMYRSMDTPPQKPPVEEDDDWPASDEEGDYGNIFEIEMSM